MLRSPVVRLLLRGYKLLMACPRFVHDAVVVAAPGVTPCHPTAGPAQKPGSHASHAARSPTARAVFTGMPIGQVFQREDQLVLEDNGCPGVPGSCQHGPGQPQPFKGLWHARHMSSSLRSRRLRSRCPRSSRVSIRRRLRSSRRPSFHRYSKHYHRQPAGSWR